MQPYMYGIIYLTGLFTSYIVFRLFYRKDWTKGLRFYAVLFSLFSFAGLIAFLALEFISNIRSWRNSSERANW